jgi:hypothetical protein
MARSHLTYAVFLTWLGLSCAPDAPHDNPVDPSSPAFSNTGAVTGQVVLLSDPRIGIPSAQVAVDSSGPVYLADAAGRFTIGSLPAGPAVLVTSKEGYWADTVHVTVQTQARLPLEIRLDALPTVDGSLVVTQKIDEYFPGPSYRAEISADVNDPDGISDVDSVWSVVAGLHFAMSYSPVSRLYQVTVLDNNLPTNNLQWLVGKEIQIEARDFAGAVADAGGLYVSRIIEESAIPLAPAPGDTTGTFFHTLTLAIVRQDAGTQTPIWSQSGVDASLQSYEYGDSLVAGSYFWTIAVVDEFGNVCRSKPSSFIVN